MPPLLRSLRELFISFLSMNSVLSPSLKINRTQGHLEGSVGQEEAACPEQQGSQMPVPLCLESCLSGRSRSHVSNQGLCFLLTRLSTRHLDLALKSGQESYQFPQNALCPRREDGVLTPPGDVGYLSEEWVIYLRCPQAH